MKLKKIAAFVRDFFRLGVNTTNFPGNAIVLPAGLTADNTALWGLLGMVQNLNESCDADYTCLVGGTATSLTATAAQVTNTFLNYSGSPGGGVTLTTPTAAQIIAALPNTIPADAYNYIFYLLNDSAGQTVTLTAGTNVTMNGTATVATATCRMFLVNVKKNAGTVTFVNLGTQNL